MPRWKPNDIINNNDFSYKVRDVGLLCNVFDVHLGVKRALVIVKDQFILGLDINEVGTHVEWGTEKVGMGLEILVTRTIFFVWTLWHLYY